VASFQNLGRILLTAMADAATGRDLVLALDRAAGQLPGTDADLAALAAEFASLARLGAAERRLALAVLRDVREYAERRPPRTR
jgi:hypothetical protein